MAVLTQEQQDSIYNALVVGMSLDDAYVFAGLSPAQIEQVSEDEDFQSRWAQVIKGHEYGLLQKLNSVMEKQQHIGKEGAVTWALEHMYPQRYANKNQGDGKTVNIVFGQMQPKATGEMQPIYADPADDTEVVEIHN